jgi:signal transduction histidine kinase
MSQDERRPVVLDEVTVRTYRLMNHFFHDFKGGLSAILMMVQAIRDGMSGEPLNEDQDRWMARAVKNCQHMVELVDDFRDMSLIDEGRFPPEPEELDLAERLAEIQAEVEQEASARNVTALFAVEGEPGRGRFADTLFERVIRKVLLVILDNTRRGGQLLVDLSLPTARPARFVMDVRYDGTPHRQDELDSVFDGMANTELGLRLGRAYTMRFCWAAARHLGGDLHLETWGKRGNRLLLTLPYKERD